MSFEYEKPTQTYIINGIRRLNRELQLSPRLETTVFQYHPDKWNYFKRILEGFINSYVFLDYEGDVINDDSLTAFINRYKKEKEEQKKKAEEQKKEEEGEEEQEKESNEEESKEEEPQDDEQQRKQQTD